MDQKKELIQLVLHLFQQHGVGFTMDEVANGMKMSKKTIYKKYGNKEDLIVLIVEVIFKGIEIRVQQILQDDELNTVEKLIQVSCAHPDIQEVDYHVALMMKKDFPTAYSAFIHYIEEHWDIKKALYIQGMEEGKLAPIDFKIFKCILLGTIKEVLEMDICEQDELLERCVMQILNGFVIR